MAVLHSEGRGVMLANTRLLLTMTAQVVLSGLFITGYFFLLWQFMRGNVKVPADYKEMFIALLGVMTAGVGTILAFWFSRQRPSDALVTKPDDGMDSGV
jgi:Zn-dependent protease with chaperone function